MSTVQFFTTRSSAADLAQERALSRFRGRLAAAHGDARHERVPLCPLRPDAWVTHEGTRYAVEWMLFRFGSMSPTQVYALRVTSCASGEWVDFDQVIRRTRRSRKTGKVSTRYHSPAGGHASADEVQLALVALAAARLHRSEVAA